jgi:hypothetical protein
VILASGKNSLRCGVAQKAKHRHCERREALHLSPR